MAWTTITRSCGHPDRVQLIGPYRERERKAAYLATITCEICRLEAGQQTAHAQQAQGMAALRGTPKQIAWAATIRRAQLAAIDRLLGTIAAGHAQAELADTSYTLLRQEASCSWWIEHRDDSPQALLAIRIREIQALRGKVLQHDTIT